MKISLFLMGYKGLYTLRKLVEQKKTDNIECIILSKDKSIQNDYYPDLIETCTKNGIKYYDRTEDFQIASGYAIAISWRWLIGQIKTQVIVLHDSLLPKYRGFAPLVCALINGDTEIGVTALHANSEYDKGEIINQKKITISYPIKIEKAINEIAVLYAEIALEIIEKLDIGAKIESSYQDGRSASYSLWMDDKDYFINWNWEASFIKRFIDSVGYPYNGAMTFINGKIARVIDSEEIKDVRIINRERHIGKVIFVKKDKPVVVCGKGLLRIKILNSEKENKTILPLAKFRSRFEGRQNEQL